MTSGLKGEKLGELTANYKQSRSRNGCANNIADFQFTLWIVFFYSHFLNKDINGCNYKNKKLLLYYRQQMNISGLLATRCYGVI